MILVLGAGVAGLIVARALQTKGKPVLLIERDIPGGAFALGAPKFLVETPEVVSLLKELKVAFSSFLVVRGILLRGQVHTFPKVLINNQSSVRIQRDYWAKCHRVMPDDPMTRWMDDATTHCPKMMIRCHEKELVEKLSRGLRVERAEVLRVTRNEVFTSAGVMGFWRMVSTIPLWEMERLATFEVPIAVATKITTLFVVPFRDRYSRWDLVYTPYTPTHTIHRLVCSEEGYAAEASGDPSLEDIHGDLQFLFPEGYFVKRMVTGLTGELVPMNERPQWPHGVLPAGRYSQWVQDFKFHHAVARAKEVMRCLP
jgi:hypothetical protein